jgi:hypothetical protein
VGGAGSRPWHRLARLSRRASAAAGCMVGRRSGLAWSWALRGRRAASAGVCGEERLVLCLLVVVVVVVAKGFVSLRIDRLMAGWLVSFHLLLEAESSEKERKASELV